MVILDDESCVGPLSKERKEFLSRTFACSFHSLLLVTVADMALEFVYNRILACHRTLRLCPALEIHNLGMWLRSNNICEAWHKLLKYSLAK